MVRQLIGNDRYEGAGAAAVLQAVHDEDRVYLDFFQSVRKLEDKRSVNGKTRRRYDTAQTPYHRVLASATVCKERKCELKRQYATLAPLRLRRQIEENLRHLWSLRRSPSL